jgi:hypothetical protein
VGGPLLAATGDLPPSDSGLASGIASTSFMLGGALGLAVLASIAAAATHMAAAGHPHLAALTSGYHAAFWAGAACAALAAARWLRLVPPSAGTVGRPVVEPALIAPASQ